jgi:hypothetical protein
VPGVFQNIDSPPPSPPSECVLPPHKRRGGTHSPVGEGGAGHIMEDARHRIDFIQYNLSKSVINAMLLCSKGFIVKTSVAESRHFGVDPKPDPRIHASAFLLITF